MFKVITTQLNMSNDYFKAQGWFKNYALNSEDSRGMFQRLVKEDEKVFRLASAETDRIKNMINKKYGPGTIKYGSETPQPPERPDVIEIDALNRFVRDNPMADGGRIGFKYGSSTFDASTKMEDAFKAYKNYKKSYYSGSRQRNPIMTFREFLPIYAKENYAEGGRIGYKNAKLVIQSPKMTEEKQKISSSPLKEDYLGQLKDKRKVRTSSLNDAVEVRNIIVKNKGHISNIEELGKKAGIFVEGKSKKVDPRKVKLALDLALDSFPELKDFQLAVDKYPNIDGKKFRQLDMIAKSFVNYTNTKNPAEAAAHLLPDNMAMVYEYDVTKKETLGKGLFDVGERNINLKDKKFLIDRISTLTGQNFNIDQLNQLITETQNVRKSEGRVKGQLKRNAKMNEDIKKLYDDKVIQNLIKGDLDNKTRQKILDRAVDIVGDDLAIASRRLFQMAESMAGTRPIEGIIENKNLGNKLIDTQRIIGKNVKDGRAFSSLVYNHYAKTIDNALGTGPGKSFLGYYQQKIKNALDAGMVPDEIFSVTASARRNMHPYAIFTQALDADVNSSIKGANLDGLLSKTHRDLQEIFKGRTYDKLNTADKKAVQKLVSTFENAKKDVLKNLKPEVRDTIQLAEFDLKNPPSKSIANYDSYDKNLQKAFDKSFKETGYSMKVTKDMKTQKELLKEIETYITDRTGKVKQPMLSSGFSGAFEMLSDDLKKIINSEGFKTFKAKIANPALKTAVSAAKLPTKIFGAADLVLGYLDYTNNRQKGFSKEDSTRHMVDAVLFGATSFGEKGDIEGVKKTAMQNGMSEEVFNNLVNINTNQKAMINRINESKAKFNESMDIIESGTADPVTEKMLIQKLKADTKEFLTNTMKNIVDDSRSLNTNLQVQEAGAPININVDRQKAFSDLGKSSREFVQKRIDASDPKIFEQGDTTMGKIGSTIKETVMQPDFYTGFFKKTKAQKDREDMEKLKIQDPTLYYKMLMSEGVDPRIKLNIPVQLEFEQKYGDKFGTQLTDSLTQNKAEGGITGLRSKYEYKK